MRRKGPCKTRLGKVNMCKKQSEGTHTGAPCSIKIAGLMGDSIVDGPGLRVTIFCQGCPHNCPGCHNQENIPFVGGTEYTVDKLYSFTKKYPLCRAVTFSGGEPFAQAGALVPLAVRLKEEGYELAAYTGYTFEFLQESGTPAQKKFLALMDVLVDSPFILEQRNLAILFRGSENQRILNVPSSLQQKKPVWETAERWVGEK